MTGPLISAASLAALVGTSSLRIADVRWYLGEPDLGESEFRAGHIPGAVHVHLEDHLSATAGPGRHPLPEREDFAATMSALGFGDDHLIVAYDDRGGAVAARLWWMLRDIGHSQVAVLDGGLPAWVAEGGTLEEGVGSPAGTATMTVRPSATRSIDREGLAMRLGELAVVDARAAERYRGDEEPIDPVGGHIPTAVNVPYEENLDTEGRFLPPRMLAARYRSAGLATPETVVYCGSGVTACHDALAMVVAGLGEPILYPGSWSDWSTEGMPVAVGDEPGEALPY